MLRLEHDRIVYQGITVAFIKQDAPTFALRHFEDAFSAGYDEDALSELEDDHEKACKAKYDEGRDDGIAETEERFKAKGEELREQGYNQGFVAGHAQGILDAGKSSDVERVQILLNALTEMHNLIQPIWVGVKEEGQWKPRSIKIGEAKRAAQSALSAAHRAINAYRAD